MVIARYTGMPIHAILQRPSGEILLWAKLEAKA